MAHEKHSAMTIHAHGDGTFHSHPAGTDGYPIHMSGDGKSNRTEHESAGHAAAYFLKMHAQGDHVVGHGHEDGYTTHGIHDGESHMSEHDKLTPAKAQMGDCIDGSCD